MSTAADAPRGSPRRSGGRSMRTFLMTWLWALVAVYVLVTLLMFLAQRSLIYPAAAIAPQIADQGLAELRAIVTERSEEHTSELQSLLRISYAVFCLKKTTIA